MPEAFITSDPSTMGKFDHIPELTGASVFQAWKTQIVLTLGHEGVYNHISDRMDPTDFAKLASHLPTPTDPDALTSDERKLIQDWLKDDVIAKDIICHRLSPAILQLVPQEQSSTAHNAWQLLHSHLNHIDLGSQYLVWEKILGLQMKDAKDAQHYLGEHDSLCWDLIQMQVTYTDSEAIFNLLKGLPHTGTWPAFKLVLQTSISSASGIPLSTSVLTSVSTAAVTHQTRLVQWTWNILSIWDYPGASDECDPHSSHPLYENQPSLWRRIHEEGLSWCEKWVRNVVAIHRTRRLSWRE